jgi:hypothetical protein
MGQQLAAHGLRYEQAAVSQYPRDLPKRPVGAADVMAGAEVDDHVEGAVRERECAHIGAAKLDLDAPLLGTLGGGLQQRRVNVDADEMARSQGPGKHRERNAATATDLQDAASTRKAKERDEDGQLDAFLEQVAARDIGERLVFLPC